MYAAAAGYTGMMVGWGCTMWGTGWSISPLLRIWRLLPRSCLRALPDLRGIRMVQNPWTGGYGRSAAVYGPYGGPGVGARYNPRTGTYARGAAAYGPVWRARRCAGLQSSHGHIRNHALGLERVQEVGDQRPSSAVTARGENK